METEEFQVLDVANAVEVKSDGPSQWMFTGNYHRPFPIYINSFVDNCLADEIAWDRGRVKCLAPRPGCMIFFYVGPLDATTGWDAFTFEGKKWVREFRQHSRIQISKNSMRVWVGTNTFIETSHYGLRPVDVIGFWAGDLTLSDLILMNREIRMRPKLRELQGELKKLEGALPKKTPSTLGRSLGLVDELLTS